MQLWLSVRSLIIGLLWLLSSPLMAEQHVVYAVEVPPFIEQSAQGVDGIIVRITREAFEKAGHQVTIKTLPWARALSLLEQGHSSGLIPTIKTAAREKTLGFPTQPVFEMQMAFFKASDRRQLEWNGNLEQLSRYRFVKLRRASFSPEFDSAIATGALDVSETNSFFNAMRLVQLKRADLAAMPYLTGLQLIKSQGLQNHYQPLLPLAYQQQVYIALPKSNPQLTEQINQQLALMWQQGRIEQISRDYLQQYQRNKPVGGY